MCSHFFPLSYLTKSDYLFGRWRLTKGSKIRSAISTGNGIKLETDMLVEIFLEDYENATFSSKKCEMYFSYLKLRDTEVTDNTSSS